MRWVVVVVVCVYLVAPVRLSETPSSESEVLTTENVVKGPGQWHEEDLVDQPFFLDRPFAYEYVNKTGNLNATLVPLAICQYDCHGRGVCVPIPSPSPTPSVSRPGLANASDPILQDIETVLDDPAEYARQLALNSTGELKETLGESASPSPMPPPPPKSLGASPSPTPLMGQMGGPVAPDMIAGVPPGYPGGAALHFQRRLVPGMCVCNFSFFGPFCQFEYCYPSLQCMGRGVCRNTSTPYNETDHPPMYCECEDGWKGDNCEFQEKRCGVVEGHQSGIGANCSHHGMCYDGVCVCREGYEGAFCERRSCPSDCSGHGFCDHGTGVCKCDIPFFGKTCSLMFCPGNCSGHGICDRYIGECDCDPLFYGETCDKKYCLHDCSGRGVCDYDTGECNCTHRWGGVDCSVPDCPNDCGGKHQCVDGRCVCDPGWMGLTCNTSVCWHHCSSFKHARCHPISGNCTCLPGWIGSKCEIDNRCPKWVDPFDGTQFDCSNNGFCLNGKCFCRPGWTGWDCSSQYFRCGDGYACENGGTCEEGRCVCVPPWKGFDCSLEEVPLCSRDADCVHGVCLEGACHCADNWTGIWCHRFTSVAPYQWPGVTPSASVPPSPTPANTTSPLVEVVDVHPHTPHANSSHANRTRVHKFAQLPKSSASGLLGTLGIVVAAVSLACLTVF